MSSAAEKDGQSLSHADATDGLPRTPSPALEEKSEPADSLDSDLDGLRRVPGPISGAAWLMAVFCGGERFAWYALQAPLQNYIQNPASDRSRPGALGMGQSTATALNAFLRLVCFTTPIFAGVLADGKWGPYKTLVVSCIIYLCGLLLLLLTSTPFAIHAGAGLGGLIAAFVLIGLAVGGVKSSVAPFTADQLRDKGKQRLTLKTGEYVVVDHELTVRRVYSIFYWFTNLGALSALASTSMEKYLGFWTAFTLAFGSMAISTVVLVVSRRSFFRRRPEASFRAKLLTALWYSIRGGFTFKAAEPAVQLEKHGRTVPWDDQFVDDLRQGAIACKVWLFFPIVWLCYDQNQTNLVSQAGQMVTYGIPNDAISTLNPIVALICAPIFEGYLYPFMNRIGIPSRPTVRMTLGFALTAISMAIASGVQQVTYNAPPCYNMPLQCPASQGGATPNAASVLLQLPVYVLGGMGEVLWAVAGSEYAYTKAAPHMKSTIQSATMLTIAVDSALGLAVSPAAHNPNLVILFAAFAAAMTVTTVVFAVIFWRHP